MIDFNKDMFVGLSFGVGSSGGYGLSIINVIQDNNEIKFFYLSNVPKRGGICPQSNVDLLKYITIPKSTLPNKFIEYVIGQPG